MNTPEHTPSITVRESPQDASERVEAAIPEGMVAWAGDDSAPKDWDGGQVLLEDGSLVDGWEVSFWTNDNDDYFNIIAYTPVSRPESSTGGGEGVDLDGLRALLERAGLPWETDGHCIVGGDDDEEVFIADSPDRAALIVAAVNVLPALLAALSRQPAEQPSAAEVGESNKFGTRQMQSLVDRLRLAVADKHKEASKRGRDLEPYELQRVRLLIDAAETLSAAHRYWMAVEAAVV